MEKWAVSVWKWARWSISVKGTVFWSYRNSLTYDLKIPRRSYYIKSHVYLPWHVCLNVSMTSFIPNLQKGEPGGGEEETAGGWRRWGQYLNNSRFVCFLNLFHLKDVSNSDESEGSFSQNNLGSCGVNHPAPQKLNITWFVRYYCKEIWEIEIETKLLKVNKNLERNIFLLHVKVERQRWT